MAKCTAKVEECEQSTGDHKHNTLVSRISKTSCGCGNITHPSIYLPTCSIVSLGKLAGDSPRREEQRQVDYIS